MWNAPRINRQCAAAPCSLASNQRSFNASLSFAVLDPHGAFFMNDGLYLLRETVGVDDVRRQKYVARLEMLHCDARYVSNHFPSPRFSGHQDSYSLPHSIRLRQVNSGRTLKILLGRLLVPRYTQILIIPFVMATYILLTTQMFRLADANVSKHQSKAWNIFQRQDWLVFVWFYLIGHIEQGACYLVCFRSVAELHDTHARHIAILGNASQSYGYEQVPSLYKTLTKHVTVCCRCYSQL